jgi:hypothetical protein
LLITPFQDNPLRRIDIRQQLLQRGYYPCELHKEIFWFFQFTIAQKAYSKLKTKSEDKITSTSEIVFGGMM